MDQLAGIGDNSGGMDTKEAIKANLTEKHPDVVKRSADLAGMIERAPKVAETQDQADKISEAVRQCTAYLKSTEALRVDEKEPYLEGERAVDGFFNNLKGAVDKTKKALLEIRTAYDQKVEAAERARLKAIADEERRAAQEAERAAAEAARKVREAKEAEEKKAAEAREAAAKLAGEARRKAEEAEKKRAAEAAAKIKAEKEAADREREMARAARGDANDAKDNAAASTADLTRSRTDTGVLSTLKKEWRHEVVDEAAVPREFCKSNDPLIKGAIKAATDKNGKCNLRIAGVRIYEHVYSAVR